MDGQLKMLALLLLLFSAVSGEYIFTLPQVMQAGSTTSFCLLLRDLAREGFEPPMDFTVTVRLEYMLDDSERSLKEVQKFTFGIANSNGDFQQCHEVQTPSVDGRFLTVVNATVTYSDMTSVDIFGAEKFINVNRPKLITLVQTDKPIYKPGQTVKFRVMTMNYTMMSKTDGYQQITIETPNGLRVMQWDDVPSPNGLVSLEMPLSSDPVLGSWLIKVVYGSTETKQTFKVDEYVLPKFEVTVTPPKYLLPTTKHIHGTVCAKYTYGKPVKGQLKMKVCYKYPYSHYRRDYERPCAEILETINGCYEFFIPSDDIMLGRRLYGSWGTLTIDANVTEDQTGIELSGSSTGPHLTFYPLNLRLEDDSDSYFKPGFPYNGRVKVTNPDGSPAAAEQIRVEASNYNSQYNWVQNFTTDENGIVHFVITEFESGMGSLNIRADAVVYESDWRYTSDELYFRTYTPQAYLRITKWFSPSESYLYMPDVDQAVECNSELKLDVFYTAEVGADYKFMVIVKAGDKITYTHEKTIRAADHVYNIEILSVDESHVLQKEMKPTPPPPIPTMSYPPLPELPELELEAELEPVVEEIIEAEVAQPLGGTGDAPRKKRDVEPNLVGYFHLFVPVNQDMSPNAKILVFYIRTDKEVVASSLEFDIKTCFKNKVTMSFDETTVRPGADVNLNLGASASSTCFVGMVDKSVTLLGGNNQLTPSQLFEKIKCESRPYRYTSYWQEDREYCEKSRSSNGPEDYYYSYYTSQGVDAIHAFRDLDMWVETDAMLETRPCEEQRHMYYMEGGPVPMGMEGLPGAFGAGNEERIMPVSGTVQQEASSEPDVAETLRTYFPETWLWDIVNLGFVFVLPHMRTGGGPAPMGMESVPVALAANNEQNAMPDAVQQEASSEPDVAEALRTYFPETWLWDIVNLGTGGMVDDVGGSGVPVPVVLESQAQVDVGVKKKQDASEPEPEEVEIRTLFPETWLWDIVSLGEDGTFTYKTQIPDTITEWVGNTVCTHESDGVGVTELTGVTAFKPFFVSLTLPYSAIRGEELPILVTVFNYLSDCITLEVQFRMTEGFEFTSRSSNSRQFCLCGGESESTKFYIMPTIIGEIDLEVIAISRNDLELCQNVVIGDLPPGVTDGVQRQLLIEAEGMPLDQTKSSYICVGESEVLTEVIEASLPPDMVPDSERATVSVVGDIMGPTLSNLKNLLRMPYGCGEQNMASWAPNIYVLRYLENTEQLTLKLEEEAEGYMRVGYQRQMKYRHNDNSYSAWGENSYGNATGSSWLTAFVVKSMAQSSAYIVVDKEDILRSARWLVSNQEDNGCFPRIGKTFSSYLKGGLDGDNPAGLTAFTLTALLQADLGEAFMTNISNGFWSCLESFDLRETDTYTLTLMLYAYTLYDIEGTRRADVMSEILRRRIDKDGLSYWKRDEEDTEPENDYWWYRAPSAEVEMTSYVLLSMLADGRDVIGEVQPIVQWLTKQRNPYGGFSSTQDTVVALQALAEFGKLTYSGDTAVTIEAKNRAVDHVFSVTPSNSLVYQSVAVNPSQGPVEITTSGIGCALVQMNLKYNVYKEEDDGPAFDVKVSVFKITTPPRHCAFRRLEVCASYLKKGVSNMAIAEVKMLTGWNPVSSSLDELLRSNRIQKYEVDKNYVQLYFDELSSSRVCVDFKVEQEIEMNPKPGLVKVYDYYETRYSVTKEYEIKTTCGTKEEIPYDNEGLDCTIMQCRVDLSKEPEATCPLCVDSMDKDRMEKLICDSEKIYKAVVRRTNAKYSMKLKANLRVKGKIILDHFVNYKMDDRCTCPIIESGPETRAFIFATQYAVDSKAHVLTLTSGETIIPYSKETEGSINRLTNKNDLCGKMQRLRRSTSPKSAARLRRLRRRMGLI